MSVVLQITSGLGAHLAEPLALSALYKGHARLIIWWRCFGSFWGRHDGHARKLAVRSCRSRPGMSDDMATTVTERGMEDTQRWVE